MTQSAISISDLEAMNDLDWFDTMCSLLSKEQNPTTKQLTELVGVEDNRFSKENRGSKFLVPYDQRFKSACVNPDLSDYDNDKPLDNFSIGGADFCLNITDIIKRFPDYKIQRNVYDGGTQLFFHPVNRKFEFSALSFRAEKEPENLGVINSLVLHHVTFMFGDKIYLARDGYHMQR